MYRATINFNLHPMDALKIDPRGLEKDIQNYILSTYKNIPIYHLGIWDKLLRQLEEENSKEVMKYLYKWLNNNFVDVVISYIRVIPDSIEFDRFREQDKIIYKVTIDIDFSVLLRTVISIKAPMPIVYKGISYHNREMNSI